MDRDNVIRQVWQYILETLLLAKPAIGKPSCEARRGKEPKEFCETSIGRARGEWGSKEKSHVFPPLSLGAGDGAGRGVHREFRKPNRRHNLSSNEWPALLSVNSEAVRLFARPVAPHLKPRPNSAPGLGLI